MVTRWACPAQTTYSHCQCRRASSPANPPPLQPLPTPPPPYPATMSREVPPGRRARPQGRRLDRRWQAHRSHWPPPYLASPQRRIERHPPHQQGARPQTLRPTRHHRAPALQHLPRPSHLPSRLRPVLTEQRPRDCPQRHHHHRRLPHQGGCRCRNHPPAHHPARREIVPLRHRQCGPATPGAARTCPA